MTSIDRQIQDQGELAQSRLTEISACSLPGAGVTRLPFTEQHRQALAFISGWMRSAEMEIALDAAGTLVGRRQHGRTRKTKTFILGSHQDSVRNGGRYDGIMGVVLACMAVEKAFADGWQPDFAIEVHAYADEEGVRFPTALLGPRALAGSVDMAVLDLADDNGITVRGALDAFGGDAAAVPALKRDRDAIAGYLEAHIEQGPVLENDDLPVGIVTSICGIERNRITISGKTGHAGTVPMQERRDALVAASHIISELTARAEALEELRATFGTLTLLPGAVNQIPQTVTLSLEIRSPNDVDRQAFSAMARSLAAETAAASGCTAVMQQSYAQPAQDCHGVFMDKLEEASRAHLGRARLLPSGATHDASAMAALCPMAMLFVRCRGGVSHVPEEYASAADMGVAIAVLSQFLKSL